ncbi:MAG: protein-glutamate O-methyltransferase CheR [Hyphomicrobiales bacterium]|nr:protein-glutamate O-methyltransferase CheR [Hyphomicrobiales bacterium]
MTPQEFQFLTTLIKDRSGISLSVDKTYLLENRLTPLAKGKGFDGISGLVAKMRMGGAEALITEVVEAMTTNESLFFRDTKPFEIFRDVALPRILDSRPAGQPLRIWSLACSSGQEAYSIAITLKENWARLANRRIQILGTDISTAVLQKAKAGIYTHFEVQRGMPVRLLVKYFDQNGANWEIKPELRQMVEFRRHNMILEAPALASADIVFCRNVLIYFDEATKRSVLEKVARVMPKDGVLFLGAAENVMGVSDVFEPLSGARGAYQRAGSGESSVKFPLQARSA